MIYVMSDIHGCYNKYIKMLQQINFSDADDLYVLGDVIDRGDEPIKILQDMMMRPNVYPIMGNHEEIALRFLPRLIQEITDENCSLMEEMIEDGLTIWLNMDGGDTTVKEFAKLSKEEKCDVLDYLQYDLRLYDIVEVNRTRYVLCHQGLPDGATLDKLIGHNDYSPIDFISASLDPNKQYFDNKTYLVTGHTPTMTFGEKYKGKIIRNKNNILIDTGAVMDGNLACLCLDTGKEYYI